MQISSIPRGRIDVPIGREPISGCGEWDMGLLERASVPDSYLPTVYQGPSPIAETG